MKGYSINIIDVDSDGVQEVVYGLLQRNSNPRPYRIFVTEISNVGAVSTTNIYTHNNAQSGDYANSDIVISNLDGAVSNGYEITFAEEVSSDRWDMITIDKNGAEKQPLISGYFINNVNGESVSRNGFVASDSTYAYSSTDVCFYVKDADDNEDSVMCASLQGGYNEEETEIDNTNALSDPFYVHEVNLLGNTGILTSSFYVSEYEVSSIPKFTTQQYIIPVDYQINGGIDLIGVSASLLSYYDDNVVNPQVSIESVSINPNTPICQNTVVEITLTLSENTGFCEYQELFINNTLIETFSNITTTSTTSNAFYSPDSVGNRKLKFSCTDTYNTGTRDTYEKIIVISNDTSVCNNYDDDIFSTNLVTNTIESENDAFDDDVDSLACNGFKVCSDQARNIAGFMLMIALAVAGFMINRRNPSIEMAVGGAWIGLILSIVIGFFTPLPMVAMIIFMISFTTWLILKGGRQSV